MRYGHSSCVGVSARRRHLPLQLIPLFFRPAVHSEDPRRRAPGNPAIERLVAFPEALPPRDDHGTTLVTTDAGLAAIEFEPDTPQPDPVQPEPKIRTGTKQAQLIEMRKARDGATIAEIVAATGGWAQSARDSMPGVLKKSWG